MLLPFVIFACLIVIVLLVALYCLYPGSQKVSTIPGLDPSSELEGNVPDIQKAGSMIEFLDDLHKEFGPIVSFWINKEFIVSIATPELFKEVSHLFDRPAFLYTQFEPMLGLQSIQFKNGPDGQQRRKLHDRSFTQAKVGSQTMLFQEVSEELLNKWSKMAANKEHIPLSLHMSAIVMKSLTRFAFGDFFKDDKTLLAFRKDYDHCFWTMENTLVDGPMKPGGDKEKKFKQGIQHLKKTISEVIEQRKKAEIPSDDKIFIDALLDNYTDEDMIFDDVITYLIGGSHTSAYFLTWALYYLAIHEDVQEKLYQEISKHYKGGTITYDVIKQMSYLEKVSNETFRCSRIAPFMARVASHDSILGGHRVPKNTPIITCVGRVMMDENIWSNPKEFNPDRFDKKPPAYAFEPFGFAGKRKCPGYRLSEIEGYMFIILAVKQFKISLVPGQVVNKQYGVVTKPAEEIWVTLNKRT